MKNKFPIIKNIEELASSSLKKDSLNILEEGYEAIVVERLIKSKIFLKENNLYIENLKIDLDSYERIFLIAIGKCANSSSKALEDIFKDREISGIVLDVKGEKFKNLISTVGTHPLPSNKNKTITKTIVDLIKQATKKDLILTVISGGGSSLMCLPYKMDCDDYGIFSKKLMNSGASISELNTVRKHTSLIKGGQFAKFAYPATVVSLILSDVPGNDLSLIASGPTVKDLTTKKDAENILKKYKIREFFSGTKSDIRIRLTETPKKDKYFANVHNILIGSNLVALEAMQKKAEDLGYNTYIEDTKIEGEARVLGKSLILKERLPKSCHIWGGETTVKVLNNHGVGGRGQEFVLGSLPYIPDDTVIIGASSDGWDNSNTAGAIADKLLFEKSLDNGLESETYLNENNSFEFFDRIGGHIITGKTGSNVSDFYLILRGDNFLDED